MTTRREGKEGKLYCSFCGKSQKEVKKLIAGPTVYICNECIELYHDTLSEDQAIHFRDIKEDLPTPLELKRELDKYKVPYFNNKWVIFIY